MRKTPDFFKDLNIREVRGLFVLGFVILTLPPFAFATPLKVGAFGVARTIIRPNSVNQETCPAELQTLLDKMLPDLPSYANRVAKRARSNPEFIRDTYVLLAAQLDELEPLPFGVNLGYPDETYLVYLKTWERQHGTDKVIRFQRYHWLYLRKSSSGWELEKMFSKASSYPRYGFYSVPGETSKSAIAEGIRLWLRDCQATS